MTNLNVAKNLRNEWVKSYATTNHVNFKKKHNLPDGKRWFKFSSNHIEKKIKELKAYLKETTPHEYSGALYGDYKALVEKKWAMRRKFQKMSFFDGIVYNSCPKKEIVTSEFEVIFYKGYYYVVSTSRYYTKVVQAVPSVRRKIIYKSRKPLRVNTTRRGSPERHSLGYIIEEK